MLNKNSVYEGQTVFYNTRALKGAFLSYIGKILSAENEEYPVVLLKGRQTAFPAFYGKLSEEPKYRLANIRRDEIEEYKNMNISEDILVGVSYLKSAEDRLQSHYSKAAHRDYRKGW